MLSDDCSVSWILHRQGFINNPRCVGLEDHCWRIPHVSYPKFTADQSGGEIEEIWHDNVPNHYFRAMSHVERLIGEVSGSSTDRGAFFGSNSLALSGLGKTSRQFNFILNSSQGFERRESGQAADDNERPFSGRGGAPPKIRISRLIAGALAFLLGVWIIDHRDGRRGDFLSLLLFIGGFAALLIR